MQHRNRTLFVAWGAMCSACLLFGLITYLGSPACPCVVVTSISVHPSMRFLFATTKDDQLLRFADISGLQKPENLNWPKSEIESVAVSPTGQLVLVSLGNQLLVLDSTTMAHVKRRSTNGDLISSATWSQSDSEVMFSSEVGQISFWNLNRDTLVTHQISDRPITKIMSLSDGAIVAACSDASLVRMSCTDMIPREFHTFSPMQIYDCVSCGASVVVSAWDNRGLAGGLYCLNENREKAMLYQFPEVRRAVLSLDGVAKHGIVSAGDIDGLVRTWSIENMVCIFSQQVATGPINMLDIAEDDNSIVCVRRLVDKCGSKMYKIKIPRNVISQ